MHVSIERLRIWLLLGTGLLVIVIAGFLEYAHLRAHRFLKDLPSRLGADISRESNGFTYSQSSRGKTVYTIHAARMVQHKDGKTTLHDVGIVLYGQNQDRADRIYGSEFEYDQKDGVVRAVGEVHLDLQAPAPTDARGRSAYASGHDPNGVEPKDGSAHPDADERMVHVKTSGLVFIQSLGVASTNQEIEFQYHGLSGRAMGADYNSDTGVTVLQSDVRISGLRDGEPTLLTSSHAEMDRAKGQLALTRARYLSGADSAATDGHGHLMTAERAVIHLRTDGSIDRLVARNGVMLEQAGGDLRGRDADVLVSETNRPQVAHLSGDLTYTSRTALREMDGKAGRGTVVFDGQGRAQTAVMEGGAEVHVRERSASTLPWSERMVSSETLQTRFANTGGKQWLQDGTAAGKARMVLVDRAPAGGTRAQETTSEMLGEVLTAQMRWDGRAARLSHVTGKGRTSMVRRDSTGAEDTSEGETLEVGFLPPDSRPSEGLSGSAGTISQATQTGGVSLTHLPGRKESGSAAPVMTHATGGEATFDGVGETLTIHGAAAVAQGGDLLRADTIALHRVSGDATATGRVAVSYRQTSTSEPVHVVAAHAEFRHDADVGTFYGGGGAVARLWQAGSQVEAPVIELRRAERSLKAEGGTDGSQEVRTVLAGAGRQPGGQSQVMRIESRSLRYSDNDHRALFSGGVVLQDAQGTVRASEVVATFKPTTSAPGPGPGGKVSSATGSTLLAGSVDHVTAIGAVSVSQPGRQATGDHLVYTADDGKFVMTGSPGSPPKVQDEVQGTITGEALEFHAGDNSVMIVGDGKGGQGRRVRTETLVRQP